MREKHLLKLSTEMLEATNPYKKTIQSFYYYYTFQKEQYEVSFLELLEKELQGKHKGFRQENPLNRDYEVCYTAIANAMISYFELYKPQSYAFLQATKIKFAYWLKSIAETYGISPVVIPEDLQVKVSEQDTAITILKALHPRKRVTVNEISAQMGISDRAIQKNLKKLDPTWNADSDGEREAAFRIGGQPVEIKLDVKKPKKGKATLYRTLNTVHPLVLLENQMQIGTLLKSLAHSYYLEEMGVCYSIGLDIWYQLSDYSKDRVRVYYASDDDDLQSFIEELECAIPDTERAGFQTERSMVEWLGGASMSKEEMLIYAVKGRGRLCNLVLRDEKEEFIELMGYRLEDHWEAGRNRMYTAIGPKGDRITFHEDDLEEIEI